MLAELAGQGTPDGWFTTADVAALFEQLRIPAPGNLSREIGRLVERDLILSRGAGAARRLSLTPLGHRRAPEVLGEIDAEQLAAQLAFVPGAEFGHVRQTVLPPGLAPVVWRDGIRSLLDRSPFETNVLVMTRFPSGEAEPADPIEGVITTIRDALSPHGLHLHRADDRIVDEDLWGNVAAYMWACRYGIGLAEDRVGRGLNYNLVIEVGAMMLAGRRCAVLKDRTVAALPTDLIGRIYKPVDFDDLEQISNATHRFAADDLGLARCGFCPE